ncbi:MAG: HlyD family secretion protein [Hyphomicrobiaceae bacterium]
MRKTRKAKASFAAMAGLAFAAMGVLFVMPLETGNVAIPPALAEDNDSQPDVDWIAAAPGRVEPKSGEIKIGTPVVGRVTHMLVKVNDKVEEGELMVRLDDAEARARLASAETEVQVRKKIRDDGNLSSSRDSIRNAEDAVYDAERARTGARFELDAALLAKREDGGSKRRLQDARRRYSDAKDRVARERLRLARASAKSNIPAPNRLESAVSEARAQVAIAEALLDKTRLRASIDGTVLQVNAKIGEMVAPNPLRPLMILGDMSVMRVKAEVDEADVANIKLGQRAYIKSISYPGKRFRGKVLSMSPSLAAPALGQRGPRRATDVEVLEVMIELDGDTPLLPGMRADAFFKEE